MGSSGGSKMGSWQDKQLSTLYFTDEKREIDFVLAFEQSADEDVNLMREKFHTYLNDRGLETEFEDKAESFDGKTCFVKIHAPCTIVAKYAEMFSFKMPFNVLKDSSKMSSHTSSYPRYTFSARRQRVLEKIKRHGQSSIQRSSFSYFYFASDKFCYNKDLIPDEPRHFCIPFHIQCEKHFCAQHEEECITRPQRSYIVWQILNGVFSNSDHFNVAPCENGIAYLVRKNIYTAAYPLHDGPVGCGKFRPGQEIFSDRRVLYSEWARFSCMFKIQPLDKIRRYFGDRIGLFFAWMSFYTKMLSPVALIGLFITSYGIASIENSPRSIEVCAKSHVGNITMCPVCTIYCPYYKLAKLCHTVLVHHVFDTHMALMYSNVIVIWAFVVLKFWKRQEAKLVWMWDLTDQPEQISETPSTEYHTDKHFARPLATLMFLVFLMADVAIAVLIYQLADNFAVNVALETTWMIEAPFLVCIITSTIDVICVIVLDKFYVKLALWLVDLEFWHNHCELEKSLVTKAFLFQFANTFSSFIYIAFFKGKFRHFPGDNRIYFGLQQDECELSKCFLHVTIHLMVFVVGKYIVYMILSWFYWNIKLKLRFSLKFKGKEEKLLSASRWEQDYLLENQNYKMVMFDEYLSQVMQFGMMTLFIAAFPPVSFFALVHNIFKLRMEALKCVNGYRRPVAIRVPNNGAWNTVLHVITVLCVILNSFVVTFSSDIIPHQVFTYWYSCNQLYFGFQNFSLSYFNVSDFPPGLEPVNPGLPNVTVCRYSGILMSAVNLMKPDFFTARFLMILAARLVVIVVWQYALFGVATLIFYFVPDVPHDIKEMKHQEATLQSEVLSELIRGKSRCALCGPAIHQLDDIQEVSEPSVY